MGIAISIERSMFVNHGYAKRQGASTWVMGQMHPTCLEGSNNNN